MKKFASVALSAALLLTLFAGCGAREKAPETTVAPETTLAPETNAVPETQPAPEATDDPVDGLPELNAAGLLIEQIYANHKETDLPIMTTNLEITNPDLLVYNTGLTSADKLAEGAVSELMMGQPYSMVVLKVKDAADAAAVAQELYDSVDMRKWICVEADTKVAAYYDDVVFFFMVGSDFSEDVSTESMLTAFKAAAGKDVTVIG